jgi:hypothetical protein
MRLSATRTAFSVRSMGSGTAATTSSRPWLFDGVRQRRVGVSAVDFVDRDVGGRAERDLGDVATGPARTDDERSVDRLDVDVVDVPAQDGVDVGLAGDPLVAGATVGGDDDEVDALLAECRGLLADGGDGIGKR